MPAADFPNSPTIGQEFIVGNQTRVWTGTVWAIKGTTVTGYTGSTGFTGSQGILGFTGSRGFTGSAGFTGSQGIIGFSGSVGFTGSSGFTGSQGIIGFTGSTGFTGSQGIIGFAGSTGFTGSQGIIGFTGSQGIVGFTGSQGVVGFTGSQGIIGFTGSTGFTGSQGIIGFTGSQGIIGFTGSTGFTGSQGIIGFAGSVGFTGSQGITGFTGSWGGTAQANVNMNGFSINNANSINVNDVNVSGNLIVSGTTTYINSTALNIGDSIITLNADLPPATAPTENAGIEVNRGSSANVQFIWDETNDRWTTNNSPIATGNASILGDLTVTGNTTLGDAATDSITINANSITIAANSSIDAGTLFIDSLNNRVGVGVIPTANFHVRTDTSVFQGTGGSTLSVINGAGIRASSELYLDTITSTGGDIFLRPRTLTAMFLSAANGNIGIANSTPGSRLTIAAGNFNTFQFTKPDGSNLVRAVWDGSNFHHYFNGNVFYNLANNNFTFNGGGDLNSNFLSVIGGARISLNDQPTGAVSGLVFAGSGSYANSTSTLTRITPLGIRTWAWNGTDGFTLSSLTYITQRQLSAVNNDAVLTFNTSFNTNANDILRMYTSNTNVEIVSGNFGVGTSTPAGKLDVVGISYLGSDTNNSLFVNSNTTVTRVVAAGRTTFSNSALAFGTSNSTSTVDAMRIDVNGNVGIGTTTPGTKLDVQGSNTDVRIYATNTLGKARLFIRTDTTNLSYETDNGMHYLFDNVNGVIASRYITGASGNWQFYTAGSERMRIVANGNIGIANSTPATTLHVQGNVLVGGDGANVYDFKLQRINGGIRAVQHDFAASSNSPWILHGENLTWTGERAGTVESTQAFKPYYEAFAPAAGYKEFGFVNATSGSFTATNLIPNLVMASNGNVGIGTNSPAALLQVNGTARLASNSTGGNYIEFDRQGTNSWRMNSDGVGAIFTVIGNSVTFEQNVTVRRQGLTVTPTTERVNAVDINHTWNNATAIFAPLLINVTDTASNASSMLVDMRVGGTSKVNVTKHGELNITAGNRTNIPAINITNMGEGTGFLTAAFASGGSFEMNNTTGTFNMRSVNRQGFSFYAAGTGKATGNYFFDSDTNALTAGGPLASFLANGVREADITQTGAIRAYGAFTDASNYERLSLSANSTAAYLVAEEGGTGVARDLYLGANNLTHAVIAANGNVGLGTTAPTQKLEVAGDILVTSESGIGVRTRFISGKASPGNSAGPVYLQYGSSDFVQIGGGSGSANLMVANGSLIIANTGPGSGQIQISTANSSANGGIGTEYWRNRYYTPADGAIVSGQRLYFQSAGASWSRGTTYTTTAPFNQVSGTGEHFGITTYDARSNATSSGLLSDLDVSHFANSATGASATLQYSVITSRTTELTWSGTAANSAMLYSGFTGGTLRYRVNRHGDIWTSGNVNVTSTLTTGNIVVTGDFSVTGNTILGDAAADNVTINANSITIAANSSIDAGTLFIDSLNNRIGIGTNAPQAPLHVVGAGPQVRWDVTAATDARHEYYRSGVREGYISWDANIVSLVAPQTAGVLSFATGGTAERMRIAANGNVGIGNSSPARKLTVQGDSVGTLTVAAFYNADLTNNNGSVFSFRTDTSGAGAQSFWEYAGVSGVVDEHNNATRAGSLNFFTANSTGLANRLTVISNGNVGIGTTTPSAKLDVVGNALFRGDSSQTLDIGTTTGVSYIQSYGAALAATPLIFYTGTSERMRVAANGNVGIGNTAPAARVTIQDTLTANSTATLEVNPTWNATANSFTAVRVNVTDTASNASSLLADLQVGGTSRINVDKNGRIVSPLNSITIPALATSGGVDRGFGFYQNRPSVLYGGAVVWSWQNAQTMCLGSTTNIGWTGGNPVDATLDLFIGRDAANVLAQRNGTSAQSLRVYGTFTDASNHERVSVSANTTGAYLVAESAGTGTARNLFLGANSTNHVTVSANGNVGIGTNSPGAQLDVVGTTRSGNFRVNAGGSVTGAGMWGVDNALAFNVSSLERVRITDAGNVGIGIANPSVKLVVSNAGAEGYEISPTGGVGGGATVSGYNRNTSAYTSITTYASTMTWYAGGTTRAIDLNASGNLGVGVTSPLARLHVEFGGVGQATPAALFFSNNDGFNPQSLTGLAIYGNRTSGFLDTNLVYGNTVNSYLAFGHHNGTSYAERMRMAANGNIGVNTMAPSSKFDVVGADNDGIVYRTSTRSVGIGQVAGNSSLYWGSGTAISFFSGSERARIDSSGNMQIGVSNDPSGARLAVSRGSAGTICNFTDGIAQTLQVVTGTGFAGLNNPNSGALTFSNTDERMRIAANGNVGIGNSTPTSRLFVTGDIALDGISVRDTATSTTTATTQFTLFEYPVATYDSSDIVIKAVRSGERHTTKLLVTANSTVAIATEYGILTTGSVLYTVDVDITGANTRVRITPTSTTSTVFKASYELITA